MGFLSLTHVRIFFIGLANSAKVCYNANRTFSFYFSRTFTWYKDIPWVSTLISRFTIEKSLKVRWRTLRLTKQNEKKNPTSKTDENSHWFSQHWNKEKKHMILLVIFTNDINWLLLLWTNKRNEKRHFIQLKNLHFFLFKCKYQKQIYMLWACIYCG